MTSHNKLSSFGSPWKALVVVGPVLVAISVAAYRGGGQPRGDSSSRSGTQARAVPPYYTNVRGVALPKTMPPERLQEGKVRYAYQVAARIPEVLAQLPCYCPCDRTVGHQSLLHCYTDQHAAYCDICQDSALWAEKRTKESESLTTIRQEIIDRYSDKR